MVVAHASMDARWTHGSQESSMARSYIPLKALESDTLYDLQSAGLVNRDTTELTVPVLKEAVDAWRRRNPENQRMIKKTGTKKELMAQFTTEVLQLAMRQSIADEKSHAAPSAIPLAVSDARQKPSDKKSLEAASSTPSTRSKAQVKPNTAAPQRQAVQDSAPRPSYLTTTSFASMPLSVAMRQRLETMGLEYATEVQKACIPPALKGLDVTGQAKTGTGKTLAFLIPVIETLVKSPQKPRGISMLILTPTRELAFQIMAECDRLTDDSGLRAMAMVGGVPMARDYKRLNTPIDILVATPGRLEDHLQSTSGMASKVSSVRHLVLDEMDRLLGEGFWPSVSRIVGYLPPREQRQTLLFSATMPKSVTKHMNELTRPDAKVLLKLVKEDEIQVHQHVKQELIVTSLTDQLSTLMAALLEQMKDPNFKVMVFFTTARMTALYSELFRSMGFPVLEIHSKKSQAYRTKTAEQFRQGSQLILFSSDVTARGMDFPNVNCVVQVGVASSAEQYIHRMGRTSRGTGVSGQSLLLLSDFERPFLRKLKSFGLQERQAEGLGPQEAARLQLGLAKLRSKDDNPASRAWVAMVGYYKSQMSDLTVKNNKELVDMFNEWAMWMFATNAPPAIPSSTIGKMGLKGTPGVRIDSSNGGRGGGSGGRGGGGGKASSGGERGGAASVKGGRGGGSSTPAGGGKGEKKYLL
uniref:RNA helicase n=1 Tax=Eutreptiella gymnastica TaxID=73025 RepID=A0A7S1IKQ0_9EUGL